MGSDMNPPKEPQPSQGAGAEEMAEAWIAEQREKRSRWDAMENCYRVDIGIVETWLAGHASGYSKGREEQQRRIAELEAERDSLLVQLENKSKEIGRSEHRGNTVDYIYDKLENYGRQLGECAKERDTLKAQLAAVKHDQECNERGLAELVERKDRELSAQLQTILTLRSSLAEVAALVKGMRCETNEVRINGYRVQLQHDASCLRCAALAAIGKDGERAALSQLPGVEKDGEKK